MPIFENFKMLKLQDIKFNTLKLIYLFALQGSITIKNQRYFLWQMNLLTCIIPEEESYFLYHRLIQLIMV